MTRDEILNMEAGREMDALVAEKVMGWKHDPEVPYFDRINASGDIDHISIRWSPSTDIYAAWEVVEKMYFSVIPVDEGYMAGEFDGYTDDTGIVDGYIGGFNVMRAVGLAPTAPLAICRAALLAVLE